MSTRWRPFVAIVGLVLLAGCGEQMANRDASIAARSDAGNTDSATNDSAAQGESKPATSQRRIIRKGELDLSVEQFESIPERLEAVVERFGGFIATTHVARAGSSYRRGTWTVRVPSERFMTLMAEMRRLGTVHSSKTSADDITADYTDLESRLRVKQREEERLVKLLADATGKLDEVLMVERELSRVRSEIETMQGRVAMLKDLTDLATLVVTITETPAPVVESPPTYFDRLADVWTNSLAALLTFLQQLTYVVVAFVPWFSFPLAGYSVYELVRRVRAAFRARRQSSAV